MAERRPDVNPDLHATPDPDADFEGDGPQEVLDAARDELQNPADETNEG